MHVNYIWFIVAAVASVVPATLIKKYSVDKSYIWIVLSILTYLLLIYAYTKILDHRNVSSVYSFLKGISILLVVLFGFVFFGEIPNLGTVLGMIFAIISVYLIGMHLKD